MGNNSEKILVASYNYMREFQKTVPSIVLSLVISSSLTNNLGVLLSSFLMGSFALRCGIEALENNVVNSDKLVFNFFISTILGSGISILFFQNNLLNALPISMPLFFSLMSCKYFVEEEFVKRINRDRSVFEVPSK